MLRMKKLLLENRVLCTWQYIDELGIIITGLVEKHKNITLSGIFAKDIPTRKKPSPCRG
jgi:hypothetical protein